MKEVEILSGITQNDFYKKIEEFTKIYSVPKVQYRLGVLLCSYTIGNKVDTRIKITNGVAHMVQKIGNNLDASRNNTEIDFLLSLDAESIMKLVRTIQTLGEAMDGFTSPVQQFENHIFDLGDVEVKFYKQFSKDAFYGFEVELKDDKQSIEKACNKLGLEPDNVARDADYWYEYDKKYNTNGLTLSDAELLELIIKYMNYK